MGRLRERMVLERMEREREREWWGWGERRGVGSGTGLEKENKESGRTNPQSLSLACGVQTHLVEWNGPAFEPEKVKRPGQSNRREEFSDSGKEDFFYRESSLDGKGKIKSL
jgi:hypothetical protein